MKIKMNKFDELYTQIIVESKNELEFCWESKDEYDIKIWFKFNEDPTDPNDQLYFIQQGNSSKELIPMADEEEAIWVARNVIDELKSGMSYSDAVKKWIDIMLEQRAKLLSRW
jgi:hypothetical protein